jgi:hypothetical protein
MTLTRYVVLICLALLASCAPYNGPQNSHGSASARNPRLWSVDYSNNDQHLAVLVGDQIEITLGSIGPGWQYDEPQISSSAIQLVNTALQSPPNPGGPVYIYTLKASAGGDARFNVHFTNGISRSDETFTLTIQVAPAGKSPAAPGGTDISAFDATEPILGTWVLNVAKSKLDPGHAPKSETRTFKAAPEGIKARTQITTQGFGYSGPSSIYERPDEIMTTGPQIDKITRVGPREYRIEQTHGGKVIGSQTAVVSKDGMLLTIKKASTFSFFEAQHNIRVFDRQ